MNNTFKPKSKTVQNVTKNQQLVVLMGSTIIIGIIVGLSSLFLGIFLEYVEHLFLDYRETASQPAPIGSSSFRRLLSVFIGSILAAIIWWLLRTKATATVSVKKALIGKKMPLWQTAIHVMTQIFYVGTGGSVGRELAPREAGAMLAQKVESLSNAMHIPQLSADDRKLLIAAAAGAGFAGIYIAPITGMFFSVEILLKKMTLRTITVSLTMSTIAMFIGAITKGFNPYYLVGDAKFSILSMVMVVVIAPFCGVAGAWFRKLCQWAEKGQERGNNILWQLPIMGLMTGLVATFFPQIMGNGRSLAQLVINSTGIWTISLLIIGALLKIVVTVLTIRSGASGGTLTPAIAIGSVLGAFLGMILFLFVPSISIWEAAILGACTLLAASQQAPLMALFMIFEICHLDYAMLLPLSFGVLISTIVSKRILTK